MIGPGAQRPHFREVDAAALPVSADRWVWKARLDDAADKTLPRYITASICFAPKSNRFMLETMCYRRRQVREGGKKHVCVSARASGEMRGEAERR